MESRVLTRCRFQSGTNAKRPQRSPCAGAVFRFNAQLFLSNSVRRPGPSPAGGEIAQEVRVQDYEVRCEVKPLIKNEYVEGRQARRPSAGA